MKNPPGQPQFELIFNSILLSDVNGLKRALLSFFFRFLHFTFLFSTFYLTPRMKQAGFATFSVRLLKKCEIWLQHTAKK